MLQSHWSQNTFIVALLIILAVLGFWGWSNGLAASRSKAIVKDAKSIQQGFEHFHADQNRYPTTDEFTDANLMRSYLSNFPPQNFPNKVCPKSFDYYNPSPQTYELRICLPKAASGYNQGWNTLTP
jgi:type II secretory pathway pseudopilin PulG